MKKLLKIGLVLVAILVVGLVILALSINSIARKAVEVIASEVLAQPVTVQSLTISPMAGKLRIEGFKIASVQPFEAPALLDLGSVDVTLKTGSLLSDTIEIDQIVLDGMKFTMEQKGLDNNVAKLLARLKAYQEASKGPAKPDDASKKGKQLAIGEVVIKQTTAALMVSGLPTKPANLSITVKEAKIEKPLDPEGRPLRIADFIGVVITQVGGQVLQDGASGLTDITKGAGKALEDAGKGATDALKNAGGGLQDLFGGKK